MQQIGPYLLEAKLGEGGMGAVFRARHAAGGQRVALKIMRRELLLVEARRQLAEHRVSGQQDKCFETMKPPESQKYCSVTRFTKTTTTVLYKTHKPTEQKCSIVRRKK